MRRSPLLFFFAVLTLWILFECCGTLYKKTIIENYEKESKHGPF